MSVDEYIREKDILVSFVVPIYNVQKYVRKCIESMSKLTDNRIEIILIDDGSTDGSSEICDFYAKQDSRIKVIHQLNQGVSVARNVGIDNSHGRWICFVDGDDWIETSFMNDLNDYLTTENDIIFFKFVEDHGNTRIITPGYGDEAEEVISDFAYIQRSTLNRHLCKYYVASPWAKVFCREFLIRNELKFVTGLKKAQDTLFVLQAYGKAEKGLFINKVLYDYNVHMESVSRRFNLEVVEIHNQLIKELYRVVKDTKKGQKELYDQLQVAIYRYLMASIQVNFCHVDNPAGFSQRKRDFEKAKQLKVYRRAIRMADMSSCRFVERVLAQLIKWDLFLIIDILFHVRARVNNIRGKFLRY